MSENNYGALMLKSALDTSVDVTKIIAPGIYPVISGNSSAPDSSAGLLVVSLTPSGSITIFLKESSSVLYSLVSGKWIKPTASDVNAVAKTGDTMTGPLTLSEAGVTIKTTNGDSPQYSVQNIVSGADFNIDLLGAEVRIFGKGSGSGQVRIATFNLNNGDWSVPGNLRAGNAVFNTEGSLYGNMWGGWIHDWLSANFSARDNNINTRATWDWVNQNFVSNVRFGAVESALVQTVPFGGFNDQAGYVLTGLTQNDGDRVPDNVYRRTLQINFPSRGWLVVGQ